MPTFKTALTIKISLKWTKRNTLNDIKKNYNGVSGEVRPSKACFQSPIAYIKTV